MMRHGRRSCMNPLTSFFTSAIPRECEHAGSSFELKSDYRSQVRMAYAWLFLRATYYFLVCTIVAGRFGA
jgi:hypothetical protein